MNRLNTKYLEDYFCALEYPRKEPISCSVCSIEKPEIEREREQTYPLYYAYIHRLVIHVIAFPTLFTDVQKLSTENPTNPREAANHRSSWTSTGIFRVSTCHRWSPSKRTYTQRSRYEMLFSLFIFLSRFRRRYYYTRDHSPSNICTNVEGTTCTNRNESSRGPEKFPFSILLILIIILTQSVIQMSWCIQPDLRYLHLTSAKIPFALLPSKNFCLHVCGEKILMFAGVHGRHSSLAYYEQVENAKHGAAFHSSGAGYANLEQKYRDTECCRGFPSIRSRVCRRMAVHDTPSVKCINIKSRKTRARQLVIPSDRYFS